MRADRLVATLLILQARGRVTATEVAAELEVSERTARRDLEALCVAGLPVYALRGRGGGWELAGGGRTDLSGLNAAEARTLFRLAGPAAATPVARAALRKLIRALPEPMRAEAEAAATSILVDPASWDRDRRPPNVPPHLDAVQDAVVKGAQVVLGYVARDGAASERIVHPLGLAAKGDHWYLVAATEAGLRTFRVDRVTVVTPTGEPVVRPDGFELTEAWRAIVDEVEERRTPVRATAVAVVEALPLLRYLFGRRLEVGPPSDGRVEVVVRGHSISSLAVELGGLGGRLTVAGPPELRTSLARLGQELASAYGADHAAVPAGAASAP